MADGRAVVVSAGAVRKRGGVRYLGVGYDPPYLADPVEAVVLLPVSVCFACECSRFWLRIAGGREWVCSRCHPPVESSVVFHEIDDGGRSLRMVKAFKQRNSLENRPASGRPVRWRDFRLPVEA